MLERIKSLQRLIDSRNSEIKAIRAKADSENRVLNTEEAEKVQGFLADLEGFQTNMDLCQREAGITDKLSRPFSREVRPNVGPTMDELQSQFPGLPSRENRFGSFGDQLIAAARASDPSRAIDRRLIRAAAGLNETAPTDGGFAVQMDFASGIKTRMFSTGQILQRVQRMPIGANSNSITIPVAKDDTESAGIFGGIVAYWLSEAGTKTPSSGKLEALEMKLKKMAVVVPTTDELLADAVALESWIRIGANKALVKEAEKQIIRGTGVGQPLGILNSGSLVSVAGVAGQGDTVVYDNIKSMWSRMFADSRANAIWLINQTVEESLYGMGITVGVGGSPVYMPPGGASVAPYGTLFGRPVIPCNYCSAVGTVGDILLVDLSEYLLIEKGGIQEAVSMHYGFITDQTYYRFVMRLDGQPAWKTVFTPEQAAAATQSPFIALATR